MSDTETLKVKVGPHEFEATGSPESVREKFEAFKELVKIMAMDSAASTAAFDSQRTLKGLGAVVDEAAKNFPIMGAGVDDQLNKIMRLNGREISLTARPQLLRDAILLLIFGQKALRQNDAVTGAEIITGLETTGGYTFNRIDGLVEKIALEGDLLTFGERRGKKYRLTNTGLAKARAIAAELISSAA